MKNELLKKLNELSALVEDTIDKFINDEDINDNLRLISLTQALICSKHFEYVFDKNSKKIKEILEDEKEENI